MARNNKVSTYVDSNELEQIRGEAQQLSIPVSDYVRRSCVRGEGFVYLMESEGYYKIGMSVNPTVRETQLQMGDGTIIPSVIDPQSITLIWSTPVSNMLLAERILHHYFADKRAVGEWFDLDASDVAWFARLKDEKDILALPVDLRSALVSETDKGKRSRFFRLHVVLPDDDPRFEELISYLQGLSGGATASRSRAAGELMLLGYQLSMGRMHPGEQPTVPQSPSMPEQTEVDAAVDAEISDLLDGAGWNFA